MRPTALLVLALLLAVPAASAEFGAYDETGWPLNVAGESTNPRGIIPGGLDAAAYAAIAPPLNVVGPLTIYPYYPVLTLEVQRLASEHPDIVKLHSIGKSTAGLDLWMLEIADFARIDAGEGLPLEEREVVWIDGGTHSNEYSGVYFTLHLASFLADGYETNETAQWIVENRHSWIMPMVNPDGSHAFGRLNANGVNINRNYPVVWDGVGHDELMNNRGPAPASEVETKANIEWFNTTRPDYYASVHCCGNLWLYPYGEEGVDPADNAMLARVCDEAFPDVREDCGPIWSTIYPASGSSVDTVYEYTGAVAFGYEMSGRGAVAVWGQPFTDASVEEQEYESWQGVMHAFLNVHKYGAHPIVARAVVDGDALILDVINDGYGNLTVGSLSAAGVTVPLPQLASGETAQVRLEGVATSEGDLDVRIDYVKRLAAAPEGARVLALALVADGDDALRVATIGGEPIEPLATGDAASQVPGVAPLALLALASIVALARRQRR